MLNNLKHLLKKILPSFFINIIKNIIHHKIDVIRFYGNFDNWQLALKYSKGYNDNLIIEKVFKAALKVKKGEAAYERDGVTFDKVYYFWPLLSSLMWAALENNKKLNVLDFGGALGSSYFQNIKFLNSLEDLKWNIVEQPKLVELGKKYFENKKLKFYFSIEECVKHENIDFVLLSSVLCWIENPYELIEKILSYDFKYIVIDRTLFFDYPDRIVIQKVPKNIYDASYPCRILNRDKVLNLFNSKYELISGFEAYGDKIEIEPDKINAYFEGYIFKFKKLYHE